tara:strand:+ start:367 stop:570 length:204 start_codon:yes stop_codon:yes gene_type:complete
MSKLKVQYKNSNTLKQLLSHAEEQAEHYKEYGFLGDMKYWQNKVHDYRAQLYALYHEREQLDELKQI